MNDLQVFKNEKFGEVRTVELENGIYFVGTDVASILGYKKPNNAINTHVDKEDTLKQGILTNGGTQEMILINESGLYALILSSNLPQAKEFKKWVTSEVLPMIRKTGGYIAISENDTDEDIMARGYMVAMKTIEKKNQEIKELKSENEINKQVIAEFKPIQEYVDTILNSCGTMTISQIAADYGLSGKALNKILHQEKLIRNVGGQWLLYKAHMNKGYTQSETHIIKTKDNREKPIINTKWTQKGRLKIHEILVSLGYIANMDKTSKEIEVA